MKKLAFLIILLFFGISCGPPPEISSADIHNDFPKNLSWADIDLNGDGVGENYITPIKSQPCDDCYIYATVGALEIQYQIDHKMSVPLDLSEQNIHNCLKISCQSTGDHRTILNYLRNYGVISQGFSNGWGQCINCQNYISTDMGYVEISHIPYYKFSAWRIITTYNTPYNKRKNALVIALQNGPVIVNTSWSYTHDDVYHCLGDVQAGHTILVVGYINYGRVFIVKNSHGEGKLIKIAFDGADKCGFADLSTQIVPGSTYLEWGAGEKFCYSNDDFDNDSIPDPFDNCPYVKNTDQANMDNDMFGDACDPCPNQNSANGFYCAPTGVIIQTKIKCKKGGDPVSTWVN